MDKTKMAQVSTHAFFLKNLQNVYCNEKARHIPVSGALLIASNSFTSLTPRFHFLRNDSYKTLFIFAEFMVTEPLQVRCFPV